MSWWTRQMQKFLQGDVSIGGDLDIDGITTTDGRRLNIATKTADYTLTTDDDVIVIDASSNTVTATLPASPGTGETHTIACLDSTYLADIDLNSKNFYGTALNQTLIEGESLILIYDGTQWVSR